MVFLDQQHAFAAAGKQGRDRRSGGATANHEHVVLFVAGYRHLFNPGHAFNAKYRLVIGYRQDRAPDRVIGPFDRPPTNGLAFRGSLPDGSFQPCPDTARMAME
jgi:hypothetical protein